jgi:hypothetical protein
VFFFKEDLDSKVSPYVSWTQYDFNFDTFPLSSFFKSDPSSEGFSCVFFSHLDLGTKDNSIVLSLMKLSNEKQTCHE